jgi:drug/metabolite transporter (DMT)-like permease
MKSIHKGILYIIASAFFFALMNVFVRIAGELPFVQKSFFRNFVALIFAYFVIKRQGDEFRCKRENIKFLMIRSAFGTLGILCNFYSLDHLVLSDASMLNKMSPFFIIILSFIFLKEKINLVQISAVILAFVGSLFIVKPTFSNMDLFPSLIGLLGGFGAGASYTAVRHLGNRGQKGPFIVFFFSAFSCLVTLPVILFTYEPMTLQQFIYLMLAGTAAAGGQFTITAAYTHAPGKDISVFDYSSVIFSAIFGYIIFSQVPDQYSILGYVIICATAIWMFIYGSRK